MPSIRQANRSDMAALATVASQTYIEAFGPTLSDSELQNQLENYRSEKYFEDVIDDDTILIATENELVVGYVQFGSVKIKVDTATSRDQELCRLYVLSDFQRKGIGKSLLEAALAHLRMVAAENIYLDVYDKNDGAQKLYAKYGFTVTGKIDYIEDGQVVGCDLIMMRKNT